MSHEYKLKVIVEKDGNHLDQYDKEVYVATDQYTAVEPLLTGMGIDMFGVNRVQAKVMDTALSIMNRIHYLINELYDAGTLKDVFAEIADLNDIDVDVIIAHICTDLTSTVVGQVVEALEYSDAELATLLAEVSNTIDALPSVISDYTNAQVAGIINDSTLAKSDLAEVIFQIHGNLTPNGFAQIFEYALAFDKASARERMAESIIRLYDNGNIIALGYMFRSMKTDEGKEKAYILTLIQDIYDWVDTWVP